MWDYRRLGVTRPGQERSAWGPGEGSRARCLRRLRLHEGQVLRVSARSST